jgi:hypothetical protein
MANFRMLPPVATSAQSRTVNGRTYSATPGSAIDIFDADAETLSANGWTKVALSGPTSARPSPILGVSPPYLAAPGFLFLDTTIDELIVFDGANWRNPISGASV